MTITRRFQTGFELNSLTAEIIGFIGTIAGTFEISNVNPKTGTYSLRISNTGRTAYWTFAATSQLRIGVYISLANSLTASTMHKFLQWRDGGGNIVGFLAYNDVLGNVELYHNGSVQATYSGMSSSIYHHWGVDIKQDSSVGWVKVYLDGILVLSYTGNVGTTQIDRVFLGPYAQGVPAGYTTVSSALYEYYDDLTIDDTTGEGAPAPIPHRRYSLLTPNANGTYSQWKNNSGTSVNNYLYVDEIPYNTTDYVNISGTGYKDSYGMTDFTVPASSTIMAVIPTVIAQKNDASDIQLMLGTILSGNELLGSSQAIPSSYGIMAWERQTSKPGGGSWTGADVNAMEFLMMSSGTFA